MTVVNKQASATGASKQTLQLIKELNSTAALYNIGETLDKHDGGEQTS